MKIDVHAHLAGHGTQGSGCWMSPAFRRRPTFLALRYLYGIRNEQMRTTVDQDWADTLARTVAGSELDAAVALGFDGVYDRHGRFDRRRSQMVVPPSWVLEVCQRYRTLIPGPSVNPHREDVEERLDECIAGGAVLIKWLPIVQAIDLAAPELRRFYARVAEAGIPLLIHSGTGEVTFRTVAPEFLDVSLLKHPLEAGVTVICAHTAAPLHLTRERSQVEELRTLLRRYPHLYVDNSGLANPGRFAHLARFARDPLIRDRTLHGSDYPVPSHPLLYLHRYGPARALRIQLERNGLQRDLLIKRHLGFGEESFARASSILPNLERWKNTPR